MSAARGVRRDDGSNQSMNCIAHRTSRASAVTFLVVWSIAASAAVVHADEPAEAEYAVTAWTSDSGGPPGDVFAIAQDAAGYLWLGTRAGVVRFDGERFRRWPLEEAHERLPEGPVYALIGASDGSLWVGLGAGVGVGRILQGRVTHYSPRDGAPSAVSALLEDRRGEIWAAARGGLFRFSGGTWEAMGGGEDELTRAQAFSLYEDREGAIWVGSAAGVYRLEGGVSELVDPTAVQVESLAEDGSGAIWITDNDRFVRRVGTEQTPVPAAGVRGPAGAWRILRDASGQMWVATWASLMRMPHPEQPRPVIQKVPYEHRVAGSPRALFEDRDNNIWVGMRGGLLRLSRTSIRTVSPLEGLTNQGVRTVAAGPDGSVWVAADYALNRFDGASHTAYDLGRIMALHVDRHGLWISTPESFGRFVDGALVPAAVPGGFHPRRVLAMTTDAQGTLWLCSALDGPMAWDGSRLERFSGRSELFNRPCNAIYADRLGRVWVAFSDGGVVVYDRGTVRTFGEEDGLAGGAVLAILEDRRGAMWLSTSSGITRYAGGAFFAIPRDDAPLVDIVPVLVEDDDGYIWVGVNSGSGIVRLHPGQVDDLSTGSSRYLEYAYFDETDGMLEGSQSWQAGVGGVRAGDGRLWVATGAGLAIVDPQQLPTPRPPLPPRIEAVMIEGRRSDILASGVVPAGASTLEIEYGSVHLSSASKLRYRYRLDGIDEEWASAGGSRSARYDGLPPGEYRFRVSATDSGRWTEESIFAFSVAPPFYRTTQFIVLALAAASLLVAAAWWMRLRAVQRRYSLVFAERARVSREIHDTLLQSLAAMGVELETIASQMAPFQGDLRGDLIRLRRRVGHTVRDARDSILELRRSPMQRRVLADALRDALSDLRSRRHNLPVEVSVQGKPYATPADVDAQVIRITQEAVTNALKHSAGTRIDVTLVYRAGGLDLSVTDDGVGFDREIVDPSSEVGEHLGLLTMQERAHRVGGRLTIESRPGAGTTVSLSLPRRA